MELTKTLPAKTTEWLSDLQRILLIAVQLCLLTLVASTYEIESDSFILLLKICIAGFCVHALLPREHRLAFFSGLSLFAVFLVLGFRIGGVVIGLGCCLIGLCHLPLSFGKRTLILLCAGVGLACLRFTPESVPWSPGVWPILSSMFMFRVIIYMYDTHHLNEKVTIWQSLGYFFMLPNVAFPLFPVIDYKRYLRNYFNEDRFVVYQRGVKWIFRGMIHLVLYRWVYHYLALDPAEVQGLAQVLQFSFGAFLLYLQVSGQFHIIVGILLLFGFNLPETHNLYYLASSFTDFWRRINIYWKDFVMKIFYYPVYFRTKRWGDTFALITATVAVFLATWFFHAYQWYWLRGTALLEWHDALFWGMLAVLVVLNSLWEIRYGRSRSLVGGRPRSVLELVSVTCSTLATFTTICLLWGLWSSESFEQWLGMWRSAGNAWMGFVIVVLVLFAASWWIDLLAKAHPAAHTTRKKYPIDTSIMKPAMITLASALAVYALGLPSIQGKLPSDAGSVLANLSSLSLNQDDLRRREIGYYENLTHSRHNSALWVTYNERLPNWDWVDIDGAMVETGDLRGDRMAPNLDVEFKSARLQTNQWGMRDQHYEKTRPVNVFRVAFLGSSYVLGSGVTNDQTFENLVENRLGTYSWPDGRGIEILNFGYTNGDAIRHVVKLEKEIAPFSPNLIIYFAHYKEADRAIRRLASVVKSEMTVALYPGLEAIIHKASVDATLAKSEIIKRLRPLQDEVLSWCYNSMIEYANQSGIRIIWTFIPLTYERFDANDLAPNFALARAAGFQLLDLSQAYNGVDPKSLAIAPWDDHPNAKGHELLADELMSQLVDGDGIFIFLNSGYSK